MQKLGGQARLGKRERDQGCLALFRTSRGKRSVSMRSRPSSEPPTETEIAEGKATASPLRHSLHFTAPNSRL